MEAAKTSLISNENQVNNLTRFEDLNTKDDESKEESSEMSIQEREKAVSKDKSYKELKIKLGELRGLKLSEKLISEFLNKKLADTKAFDKNTFKLINCLTATLKAFGKPGTPEFKDDNVARVLREIIVDFLLKLKDKHPFSNPKEMNVMDVYTKTMDIISEYIMKPSKILLSAYSKSEVTKKLNTLPSYQHLYDLFQRGVEEENDPSLQMKKKTYEFMMNRFNSRSPFIFYFNPNFEVTETYGYMWFGIGFYSNCSVDRIGPGLSLDINGRLYQGYSKDGVNHYYGRTIYENGDIYEGGYNKGKRHGKGEIEYYEDGRVEVGHWEDDIKQGEFECRDSQGNRAIKLYKDGQVVEE